MINKNSLAIFFFLTFKNFINYTNSTNLQYSIMNLVEDNKLLNYGHIPDNP